jgi:hypothetical protein
MAGITPIVTTMTAMVTIGWVVNWGVINRIVFLVDDRVIISVGVIGSLDGNSITP